MSKKQVAAGTVLAIVLFAITQWAQAKGNAQYIEIEVPRLFRPIEISDPNTLQALSAGQFEDYGMPVVEPYHLGGGVAITRFYLDEDGQRVPFDKVLYFAHVRGEPGYVYYLRIVNGSGPYDGKWFRVTTGGDAALWQILAGAGVEPEDFGVQTSD